MRTPSSVPIGAILAHKYRVDAVLGAGGMGIVLAATHKHLRQRVAIKLLHPEAAARRGGVERFLREARVAMSLRGEHVVRIFDVGTLDDGSPFIAMECLEGRDFGALLDAAASLEPTVAVDYILQVSEAIAEAHALGIVHRDLKPANLFLTKRVDGTPCVKVLDFGVSKIAAGAAGAADLDDTDESSAMSGPPPPNPPPEPPAARRDRITRSGVVIGSPRYMAPEQIRSPADVDARADVWALGVILFELLTGVPPFDGNTLEELRESVTSAPTPRMPNVPAGLQTVIRRCMAKEPGGRYASIHALAEALAPFASGDGALVAARVGRIVGGGTTASNTPMVRDLIGRPGRPMTRITVAVLVVVGIAAGGVGWRATSNSRLAPEPGIASSAAVESTPDPAPVAAVTTGSVQAEKPPPPRPADTAPLAPHLPLAGKVSRLRLASSAEAAVPDAGMVPVNVPDPLHLDAGFLFRERK